MSWTNDIVLEFIELYKQEQHLWNPKHPLHRNRSEISEAWERIRNSLSIHCSVTDLKKKKESLMTSFRMHLGKKKIQEDYRPTWFAYQLMESFLGGKYESDSTIQMENEFFLNTNNISTPNSQEHNFNRRIKTEASPPVQKVAKSYPKKRVDETVFYLNTNNNKNSEFDEYELFGQLIAKKLKKLDEHQRDLAMHEIDNVMFNAKMRSQNNASSSPSSRKLQKSPVFIIAQNNINPNIQYEDENVVYQEESPS